MQTSLMWHALHARVSHIMGICYASSDRLCVSTGSAVRQLVD